jgi:cyclohexanecarboxylate-CoA ligase/acyl-CoA synthetase
LLPAFSPPALAATIEAGRASVLLTAPAHVSACLDTGLFEQHDVSSLRLAIMSGTTCPPDLVRAVAAKLGQQAVSQLWGMTELQAGAFTRPGDGLDVAASSAGRACPGNEIRVVGEDGAKLGPGQEGELEVRGASIFPGYLDNDGANAEAFTADGWFRSGDLASIDAAGNLSLSGRSKDLIDRGGVKFNPLDIERLLEAHPAIAQSAIAPVPDERLGERACAYVVLAGADSITLDDIAAYLEAENVAKTKWPERLEIIAEMPLTPTRKIIKGKLRAQA